MLTRELLIDKTEKLLEKSGFGFCESNGCFDIAAKKKTVMLIKVLINIDSFQYSQSQNLSILADYISADSLLIGLNTRTEKLSENIIYERFGTAAVNIETFENMLFNEMPVVFRKRGGLFSMINASVLKEARLEKKLSQAELAQIVGVTKKSIYEHEASNMPAEHDIVKKIESVLSRKITEPVILNYQHRYKRNKPSGFEQRVSKLLSNLGFSADIIQKTPFNVVAKKDRPLIVAAEENSKKIDYDEKNISSFSSVVGTPFLLVTNNDTGKEHGITIKDMANMSSRQLMKKAKKK